MATTGRTWHVDELVEVDDDVTNDAASESSGRPTDGESNNNTKNERK